MISIEGDEIMYKRALFNRPYRTVEVIEGMSYDKTPDLLKRADLVGRPWVAWLDYDNELEDATVEELGSMVKRAPANSVLLTTFNADPRSYGGTRQERLAALESLFGDAFPSDQHPDGRGLVKNEPFQRAIADSLVRFLGSEVAQSRRLGGFVPAFNLHYQDGAPMVTVGGFLPDPDHEASVRELVASPIWRCLPAEYLNGPPLTNREISSLRSLLPADTVPTRREVRKLGFDLEDKQLESFARYYLDYPVYVQAWR
jgi:hypothetical protein